MILDTPGPSLYFALIFLLALSAFFSASETAISSANKIRLKTRAEDGDMRAAMALGLTVNYDRALSAILIGNNVANLTASSLTTLLATDLLGPSGAAIATVIITVLVLVFGEILPKSYAKDHAEDVLLTIVRPLRFIQTILAPLVFCFLLLKKLVSHQRTDIPSVTEDELKTLLDTVEEEGVLDSQESNIMQSVMGLSETTAQDILIPRVDMTAVDVNAPVDEVLQVMLDSGFTRVPVYEGSIDHCIGMLHAWDLFGCLAQHKDIHVRALMRDILIVYRTKRVSDLLTEFRRENRHLAIVTDDYGGTLGMVTLEDILEELVGDIFDETEKDDQAPIQQLGPGLFRVDGDMNVDDMFDAIEFKRPKDMEDGDYSSAAGWALDCLEQIPHSGQSFDFENLHVTVGQMEDKRILSLLVQVMSHGEEKAK